VWTRDKGPSAARCRPRSYPRRYSAVAVVQFCQMTGNPRLIIDDSAQPTTSLFRVFWTTGARAVYAIIVCRHHRSPDDARGKLVRLPLVRGTMLGEAGVECSCGRFGAVLEDERKVTGKPTYFTAVVVVAM